MHKLDETNVTESRDSSETVKSEEPSRVVMFLAVIACAGPVYYIALSLALGALWTGYDPIRDTQSELGAVDSPVRHVMNFGGFFVLGLAILCFGVVYAFVLPRTGIAALAVLMLFVAGTGMVAVAFYPCDPGCVDVTSAGRTHGVLSSPAAIGLPGAMLLSTFVLRTSGHFSTRWQVVSFWLGLLSLIAGPIIAVEFAEGSLGILQRAAMWPPLLWMSALSWQIGLHQPPRD